MGNAASQREAVEPPPEWEPTSNAQKFELVSPMSDLSDPSMFLHRSSNQKSGAAVGKHASKKGELFKEQHKGEKPAQFSTKVQRNGPMVIRQTPAADRRRKSKVIATRDSAYKHESRPREIAPPSAFYFPSVPTKESEENINRLSSSTGRRASRHSQEAMNNLNVNKSKESESENKENAKKNTPLLRKAKRNVSKAKTCLTGCFEESGYRVQLMKDKVKQQSQRGEKLVSEVGTASKIVSEQGSETKEDRGHTKKNGSFDPYNEDKKPTIMQFVDGSEKELRFNPVWRESHEGTYYDASTTTGPNRKSDPRSGTSYKKEPNHTSLDINKRKSNENTALESTYQTRLSYESSSAAKIYEELELEHENRAQRAPYAPGEATGDDASSNDLSNQHTIKEKAQNRDELDHHSDRLFLTDITNSQHSKRESLSSLATSHESTYWNCYYREQAQVLHEEDAYFDRLAYTTQPGGQMAEPSPLAGQSVATPVAALFDQGKSEQSLLGKIDRGYDDDDSQEPSLVSEASEKAPSNFNRDSSPAVVGMVECIDTKSPMLDEDTPEDEYEIPDDERESLSSAAKSSNVVETKSIHENPESEEPGKKEVPPTNFTSQQRRSSQPVDLDITPLSSAAGSNFTQHSKVLADNTLTVSSVDEASDHPSDETDESSAMKETKNSDSVTEMKTSNKTEGRMASMKMSDDLSEGTATNTKLSANQILLQTKLFKNFGALQRPEPEANKPIAGQTPVRTISKQRSSFGSAFSYKDKDVFTPINASTTYPKGSPFRPRLNVPDKAMAKASLEQPIMFTQSMDNMSRSSRDMEIHATESAPSMIESHDYRDIALGCFLEDTPGTLAKKKGRSLASNSPGVMSIESPGSATMSPGIPLLSDQAMNNAAFLFSPSYACANPLLTNFQKSDTQKVDPPTKIEQHRRESGITISTLGSRSRTSIVSARTRAVTIPVSVQSGASKKEASSTIDDSNSQKSVRFSTDGAVVVEHSDNETQGTRKSVKFDFGYNKAPDNVNFPCIETKVSDLSDTVSVFGQESLEENGKRESFDSIKPELRQSPIEEETASLVATETPSRSSVSSENEEDQAVLPGSPESNATPEQVEKQSLTGSLGKSNTPDQITGTWTYNKFSRGVTPMVGKDMAQSLISNSPVLRFKAAKNKFKTENDKVVPVKRSSPKHFKIRRGNGMVLGLAQKFDKGPALVPKDIVSTTSKSFRSSTSSASGTGSTTEDRPLMRTPQILGYKPKLFPNIFQTASQDSAATTNEQKPLKAFEDYSKRKHCTLSSLDGQSEKSERAEGSRTTNSETMVHIPVVQDEAVVESPAAERPEDGEDYSDDESRISNGSNEESTFMASVATVRQEDRYLTSNVVEDESDVEDEVDGLEEALDRVLDSNNSFMRHNVVQNDEQQGFLSGEETEDDFAEILLENTEEDKTESFSTVSHQKGQVQHSIQSVLPEENDEEDSTFTNLLMTRTYSEDESTTMSSLLAQQIEPKLRPGASAVKPEEQKIHRPAAPSALYLSPLQRTPMQSRKWRELAASAQKQDGKKWVKAKKHSKNGKKGNIFTRSSGLSERDTNVAGHN